MFKHAETYEDAIERIKALVVADCLENHFEPLENSDCPQALFPVANVPSLHYVIEMLVMSQIKDIVVAVKSSNAHREKIDFFIKQ